MPLMIRWYIDINIDIFADMIAADIAIDIDIFIIARYTLLFSLILLTLFEH